MKNTKSVDGRKFYRIESWLVEYGATVLQCAVLYAGNGPRAEAIFAKTFAYAYRRLDLSHVFLTDQNAVFAALVAACKWSDDAAVGTLQNGAPSSNGRDFEASEDTGPPQSVEEVDDESVRLLRVSPDYRIALLLRAVAGLEIADLTRILLLPRRWVKNRLTAAIHEFDPGISGLSDDTLASIRGVLRQRVELVEPGEELRERTRKVLKATVQELRAQNRHRGPSWLTYATVAMGLVSILAVDFGVHRNTAAAVNRTHPADAKKIAVGLPAPLTNLPVNTDAQFSLSGIPDTSILDHAIPSIEGIYLPSLQQAANNWPSIQLQYVPYSASGKSLQSAIQNTGAISMVPPMVHVSSSDTIGNASFDWKVSDWQFDVSGNWAFATVNWQASNSEQTVTQVYGLYLPTGQSNLIQTLGVEPSGDSDSVVVAAGDDKLIVQTGVKSPGIVGTTNSPDGNQASNNETTSSGNSSNVSSSASPAGAGSVVALPIDVYRLTGTTPLQALVKAGQIPAPFGLMQDPVVFPSGIAFSRPSSPSDANTNWYLVSWDGDVTKYAGPPNDGQRHFIVTGSGGDLWWVETTPTPSGSQMGAWQVVMAPLGDDASVEKTQAVTLSSSVAWFTAYKSEVCWIQNTDGRLELVASAMQ